MSLDDAPQSDRPAEVDSDQIERDIENDKRSAMWEVAGIFRISNSIKLLVKIKNESFILQKKLNRRFVQPSIKFKLLSLKVEVFLQCAKGMGLMWSQFGESIKPSSRDALTPTFLKSIPEHLELCGRHTLHCLLYLNKSAGAPEVESWKAAAQCGGRQSWRGAGVRSIPICVPQ